MQVKKNTKKKKKAIEVHLYIYLHYRNKINKCFLAFVFYCPDRRTYRKRAFPSSMSCRACLACDKGRAVKFIRMERERSGERRRGEEIRRGEERQEKEDA